MLCKPTFTLFSAFALFLAHAPLVYAQDVSGRTPQSLEDWKIENAAPDGKVSLTGRNHGGYYHAYACPRFDLAEAVVAAIPKRSKARAVVKRQDAAMASALRKNRCLPDCGQEQALRPRGCNEEPVRRQGMT